MSDCWIPRQLIHDLSTALNNAELVGRTGLSERGICASPPFLRSSSFYSIAFLKIFAALTSGHFPDKLHFKMTVTNDDKISRDAELIYNYHRMSTSSSLPATADAIFCLCSLDTRVALRAADLFLQGRAPLLIFSGGSGKLTESRFTEPEAEVFAAIAVARGVPAEAIITEVKSTNTGENVRFTHALLLERQGVEELPRSLILVQKPYMERRTYATFCKQWPGATDAEKGVTFSVTSPQLRFEDYFDDENPRDLVINIMVGDLVRIREYPAKGFQIEQEIPSEVWEAKDRLVAAGYDQHLP